MNDRIKNAFNLLIQKPFWVDKEKICSQRAIVSMVLAAASFVLMFPDLYSGSIIMALSSVVLVIGFLASALFAGIFKKSLGSAIILAGMCSIVLSLYAIGGGNEGFAALWILVVPMFAMNILDLWAGFGLSVYFLLFLPALFHTPLNYLVEGKYTKSFLIRFPTLYLCVFVVSVYLAFQKEYFTRKSIIFTYVDDLTGVYTRQFFFSQAEERLKKNPDVQYDLQVSDVVDFKKINEIYGVAEADKILKWCADFLSSHMDDKFIIGRYGSDQFIVMAPHDEMQRIIAPELFDGFIKEMQNADIPNCIMKFGMYENIPHDKPVVGSCDKAHIALNSIKYKYGKTRAFYNDIFEDKIGIQRRIESSMREALEKDQFKVYYQPKHDAKTGALVGAEALVRWIHPEFGFMSPGDFIPLFEQNGFIVETDFFVWNRTAQNIKKWQNMGLTPVPISVNSSKLVFEQQDLLEKTQDAVKQAGIDPGFLHIEVTETMMSDDVSALVDKLNALRAKGFKIELDDFGSGYSSMNILSTLPIDIVKLDMSFMRQFGDIKREKVLSACINLAKDLGYKTVSEGVETAEQREKLCSLGVDHIQGYYFSKPLPVEEFEQYMRDHA